MKCSSYSSKKILITPRLTRHPLLPLFWFFFLHLICLIFLCLQSLQCEEHSKEKIQVQLFFHCLPDRLDLNNEFILIEFVLEKHTVSFIDFFCVSKTFADWDKCNFFSFSAFFQSTHRTTWQKGKSLCFIPIFLS